MDPPKLQVVAPANAGVAVVLKVVVPTAGNVMGVMLTVLLPDGMVKAPRLGRDAGLPVWVSVPDAKAAVYAVVCKASAQALMVKVLLAQLLPLAGPWIS